MNGKDITLLFLTFLLGMFIGAYVYVEYFRPAFDKHEVETRDLAAQSFSVVGEVHKNGNLTDTFRVTADRKYVYIPESTGVRQEGVLPKVLFTNLQNMLDKSELTRLTEQISTGTCTNTVYRYEITLNGDTYVLDTCTTRFNRLSDIGQAFEDVWFYLRTQ